MNGWLKFALRGCDSAIIGSDVRGCAWLFLLAASAMAMVSCQQQDREITITERRELVLFDKSSLDNLKDRPPADWRRVPWTAMRYHNYRFGAEETGEVWMSVVPKRGTDAVLQNVNRWRRQFGLPPIASEETLKQISMLGATGYLVEAEGMYQPGMGSPPREGAMMLAAVVELDRDLVTVKMVGSPEEVSGQREAFLDYCKAMEINNIASISNLEDQ